MDANKTVVWLSKLWLNDDMESVYQIHRTIMRGFDGLESERVLFRVEAGIVVVQSREQPDWARLGDRLTISHVSKKMLEFKTGQVLWFRLRANPTAKSGGRRHGLTNKGAQLTWLKRKMKHAGCELQRVSMSNSDVMQIRKQHHRMTLLTVQFDGVLRVEDPQALVESVRNGVGSAKGLGCGLLTVRDVEK